MNEFDQISLAAEYLQKRTQHQPRLGLILGSGLGSLADEINDRECYSYASIPGFPVSTVKGHEGQLIIGTLEGATVVAMQGRLHYYEGYSMKEITFPLRVMIALGIETLIVTSACGGLHSRLYPGALMLVKDHINWMFDNPLIGQNDEKLGPRFPDMSKAYTPDLLRLSHRVATEIGQELFEGIHAAVSGPYFQTEAELKMMQLIGADTIGMSMVPEVLVAVHAEIKVIGIACVTDMATPGSSTEPLTHEKVMEVANQTRPKFIHLVKGIVARIT